MITNSNPQEFTAQERELIEAYRLMDAFEQEFQARAFKQIVKDRVPKARHLELVVGGYQRHAADHERGGETISGDTTPPLSHEKRELLAAFDLMTVGERELHLRLFKRGVRGRTLTPPRLSLVVGDADTDRPRENTPGDTAARIDRAGKEPKL